MRDSRHGQISSDARSWLRTGTPVGPAAGLARLGLILILMLQAKAADFTVTNTLDSGPGSLREAISNANANGGPDSISCLTVSWTIALASPLPELTEDTTIFGPGADRLTFSGSSSNRVLQIAANASVAISGITIANGYVTNAGGAGIFNIDNLTLENCAVVTNLSVSVPGVGTFKPGNLIMISSVIASNSAAGAPRVGASFFGVSGVGCAIYQDAGLTTISNCTIAGNLALGSCCFEFIQVGGEGLGGAICVLGGTIAIASSTISANLAI